MPGRTRKSNTNTKACSGACGSCRAGDKASGKPGSKPEKKASAQGAPMGGGVVDRRLGLDRRDIEDAKGIKVPSGLERRRGPGRRLSDFTKSAEDGEMTTEQFLFLVAIDEFKKANDRPFPTWTDVLEVVRLLGYRKTQQMEITLNRADDWTEPADSPSNVRPDNWGKRPVNPMGRKSRLADADGEITEPTDADFEQLERELDELEGLRDVA